MNSSKTIVKFSELKSDKTVMVAIIKSVHSTPGSDAEGEEKWYCFAENVRHGYATVETNGDIYVEGKFEEGQTIEMDCVVPGTKPGQFMAKNPRPLSVLSTLRDGEPADVVLRFLENMPTAYDRIAKDLPPAQKEQALKNSPFCGEILWAAVLQARIEKAIAEGEEFNEEMLIAQVDDYVCQNFANLAQIDGITMSIVDFDEEAEEKILEATYATYKEAGMNGMVQTLADCYRSFLGLRRAFATMKDAGILRVECAVPIKHLPDLLMTAPVMYFEQRGQKGMGSLNGEEIIRSLCDRVGTSQFSQLFQLYNLSNHMSVRGFNEYSGRDLMPPRTMKIRQEIKDKFDILVICTPYHDVASANWGNQNWARNVDPFLIGFLNDQPDVFYFLDRWTGTGLLPRIGTMIADTANHMRLHLDTLTKRDSEVTMWNPVSEEWYDLPRADLRTTCEDILCAYDEGHVFDYLRGEWELPTEPEDEPDAEDEQAA